MDMLFGTFASKSLLIVRVVLGVIFFAHGAQKVFGCFGGPGLRGVIGYFKQSLGVPAPLTVLAAFIECFGGLAMIVGLLVRPAAILLSVAGSMRMRPPARATRRVSPLPATSTMLARPRASMWVSVFTMRLRSVARGPH